MAIASGSSLCAANSTSSGTTLVCPTTAQLSVGEVAELVIGLDNTQTTDGETSEVASVADAAGNTWTKLKEFCNGQAGAAAGAVISVWQTRCTTQLNSGANITVTFANTITSKAASGWRFTVGASKTLQLASSTTLAEDAQANPAAMSFSSLANKEYLFLRALAAEGRNDTWSATANYTALSVAEADTGTQGTSMQAMGEFRILTGTGDTSDPGTIGANRDTASVYLALEEVDAGGGGTTFTRSFADTAAFTENFSKRTSKTIAENLGLSEDQTQVIQRTIAENLTLSEDQTQSIQKTFGETAGFTENFQTKVTRVQNFAENLGATENLQKQTSKTLAESVSLVGTAIKRVAKLFVETAGFSENLQTAVVKLKQFAEDIGLTENLQKRTDKSLQETLSLVEDQFAQVAKQTADELGLSENLSVQLVKLIMLADTLGLDESVDQVVGKSLNEGLVFTENLSKLTGKRPAETLDLDETLVANVVNFKEFSEAISFTENLSKRVIRGISETVILSENDQQVITKAFLENIGLTENFARALIQNLNLQESATLTETLDTVKIAATLLQVRVFVSGKAASTVSVSGSMGSVGITGKRASQVLIEGSTPARGNP